MIYNICMAKPGRPRKQPLPEEDPVEILITKSRMIRFFGLVLFLISALALYSLLSNGGLIGEFITGHLIQFLGVFTLLLTTLAAAVVGAQLLFTKKSTLDGIDSALTVVLLATVATMLDFLPNNATAGGTLGFTLRNISQTLFGLYGAMLVLVVIFVGIIAIIMLRHKTIKSWWDAVITFVSSIGDRAVEAQEELESDETLDEVVLTDEDRTRTVPIIRTGAEPERTEGSPKKNSKIAETPAFVPLSDTSLIDDYNPPALNLLKTSSGKAGIEDTQARSDEIVRTLKNFDIDVTVEEIDVGPTVTRFAVKPREGTRLQKIVGLQANLELALASSIRIEAPIPGKSLVGIELPNSKKALVGLGSMLADAQFKNSHKPLYFALGASITGQHHFADLAKLPHLLVAGATGAGKSVAVHNIITSLLYRNGPKKLRFIMVDPKRVELTLYNNIPHLLTPVIKNPKQAIFALRWAVKEMERRYNILEENSVRDIGSYHSNIVEPAYKNITDASDTSNLPERMAYIVIVIDEMADLMQSFPRELEAAIVRLAQMSRAVGIHLILSTQRPSVNVITGLIKANIPGRIALRVASQIDSRTIIDVAGAEKLLGAGDMLFVGSESAKGERLQSAYVSEDELKAVVAQIKEENGEELDQIIIPTGGSGDGMSSGGSSGFGVDAGGDDDADDDLYEEAKQVVMQAGKASTSYLQRRFKIGYSRAARLMDILEAKGVIGPQDGAKPRAVLGGSGASNDDESPTSGPSAADFDNNYADEE